MTIEVFVLLLLVAIAGGTVFVMSREDRGARVLSLLNRIEGFEPSHRHLSVDHQTAIAFEESSSRIGVVFWNGQQRVARAYPGTAIGAVEVVENGDSVLDVARGSQLLGMAIGGLALGGVGAIVGGLSSRSRSRNVISDLRLRVKLDEPENPVCEIAFLSGEVPKSSRAYRDVSASAERWAGYVLMCMRSDQEVAACAVPSPEAATSLAERSMSVADEIRKLAELRDARIISSEEFELQKRRLLNW